MGNLSVVFGSSTYDLYSDHSISSRFTLQSFDR